MLIGVAAQRRQCFQFTYCFQPDAKRWSVAPPPALRREHKLQSIKNNRIENAHEQVVRRLEKLHPPIELSDRLRRQDVCPASSRACSCSSLGLVKGSRSKAANTWDRRFRSRPASSAACAASLEARAKTIRKPQVDEGGGQHQQLRCAPQTCHGHHAADSPGDGEHREATMRDHSGWENGAAPLPRRPAAAGRTPKATSSPRVARLSRKSRRPLSSLPLPGARGPRLETPAPAAIGPGFPRPHGYAPYTAVQRRRLARTDQGRARRDARARGNVRPAMPFPAQLPSSRASPCS